MGKDASVTDLLVSSSLDKDLFCEEVILILCIRINATIKTLRRTKTYRHILACLNADVCRWVHDEASHCTAFGNCVQTSLVATHSLSLKLQSMGGDFDESRIKRVDDMV